VRFQMVLFVSVLALVMAGLAFAVVVGALAR
jgi:hypothetical protein